MKKELRKVIIDNRNKLTKEQVIEKSRKIFDQLVSLNLIKEEMNVLSYMDFRNEVSTVELNEYLIEHDNLILPKADFKTHLMTLHKIDDLDTLKKSKYGIKEPTDEPLVSLSDVDLILAPGVAFDEDMYRLGYGGGFYDRLLSNKKKSTLVVALAFDLQIVDVVPRDAHDTPVNIIVTESRIIKSKL